MMDKDKPKKLLLTEITELRRRLAELERPANEQMQKQDILTDPEERFRTLAEQSPNMIFINKGGRIVYANQKCVELMGFTKEEFYAPDFDYLGLVAPESIDVVTAAFEKHMKGIEVPPYEYSLVSKDGRKLDAIITTKLLQVDGGMVILGTVTDITDRKRAEEELLKVQKLESVSILAGGIAHDFNNILTAVLGNISLSGMYLAKGDTEQAHGLLKEAEKATLRAKELTHQMLTFSKGGTPILRTTSMGLLMKGSVRLALSGSNLDCDLSIPEDLWPAEIDEGQINQVINNVIINAKQAMPKGGKIRISAENVELDDTTNLPLQPGAYIK
ncbi:nitrogen regulation protein NR(II), partial [Acidobacteriota bacterium]